jgi:hypothetical protein
MWSNTSCSHLSFTSSVKATYVKKQRKWTPKQPSKFTFTNAGNETSIIKLVTRTGVNIVESQYPWLSWTDKICHEH